MGSVLQSLAMADNSKKCLDVFSEIVPAIILFQELTCGGIFKASLKIAHF